MASGDAVVTNTQVSLRLQNTMATVAHVVVGPMLERAVCVDGFSERFLWDCKDIRKLERVLNHIFPCLVDTGQYRRAERLAN